MVTQETILDVLRTIDDPEMPISIVDLGIVEEVRIEGDGPHAAVEVDILPTFVGCPALPMLEREIVEKVGGLEDVDRISVRFVFKPPWSVDRISDTGRRSLEEIGVTVPGRKPSEQQTVQIGLPVPCPFCKATETHMTSAYGPTRCRMIYYCDACKNSFEHMKRI